MLFAINIGPDLQKNNSVCMWSVLNLIGILVSIHVFSTCDQPAVHLVFFFFCTIVSGRGFSGWIYQNARTETI